jgi:hypothetical protein
MHQQKRGRTPPASDRDDGRDSYDSIAGTRSRALPPGWEVVTIDGQQVYLDHVTRAAYHEKPWHVWRRQAKSHDEDGPSV